jgi:parallel beta-helix repeat protein
MLLSDNSTLANNVVMNNSWSGIYMDSSWNCTLYGNSIFNNSDGLDIIYSQYYAIYHNNVSFNSWVGIMMDMSGNSTLENNTVRNNGMGIYLSYSSSNTLIYNEIFLNGYYGIYVDYGSGYSEIHHNNFASNGISPQCYDENGTNSWDDGSEGNYWDDYNGTDVDDDGIGDTPYSIDGYTSAEDRYPLMNATNTSAPERIPEIGVLLLPTAGTLLIYAVYRRKRSS